MKRALEGVTQRLDSKRIHLLIDALLLPEVDMAQLAIIKGDSISMSIAAASVLAKTARDSMMINEADLQFPQYGFARNKGYGTAAHRATLEKYGPCSIHRYSYAPVEKANMMMRNENN